MRMIWRCRDDQLALAMVNTIPNSNLQLFAMQLLALWQNEHAAGMGCSQQQYVVDIGLLATPKSPAMTCSAKHDTLFVPGAARSTDSCRVVSPVYVAAL